MNGSSCLKNPTHSSGINGFIYAYDPLTQTDPSGLMGRTSGAYTWRAVPKRQNFCGSGYLFPNYSLFTVGVTVSFNEACEKHDQCYQACGASKFACDQTFYYDLLGACGSVPMGSFNYFACQQQAYYYQAAAVLRGAGAFNDAQARWNSW